ncbi:MAG: LysR family transcriptional regulator [Hyphomicrobiales bacterium]|nr:LysR family transcriptional regulator [Hyphomicrobiales bacterium]
MKEIDFHDLDGHVLRTFLIVLEESSVSRAAERLDVTQSAVSHTLAKLRRIIGDPLFIRSGQGLTPTATALALKDMARNVLDGMKSLTDKRPFTPGREELRFIVAANDMQRDLIFPDLMHAIRKDGIKLTLELIPSGVPNVSLLRDAKCNIVLTPLPPDAPGIVQKHLFTGKMMCFFDGAMRDAPKTREDYLEADHISVRFAFGGTSASVLQGSQVPALPPPMVTVSNFGGLPTFLRGTSLLATEVSLMRLHTLRDLSFAPLPFETDPVAIYMVWHERSTNDPAHIWFRERIEEQSRKVLRRLAECDAAPS